MPRQILFTWLLISIIGCNQNVSNESQYASWSYYLGDPGGTQFSTLNQITVDNVDQLQVAWTYKSGGASATSAIQTNPLIADGIVYGISPDLAVFALDAISGKELWRKKAVAGAGISRGLMRWSDGDETRILVGLKQYVASFDAFSGELISEFGEDGLLDLKKNFDRDVSDISLVATSPGVIYKDLLIQGFMTSEDLPAVPGDIRAFDVKTGELKWTFHTIPRPGEFGAESFPENAWLFTGGANNWCGMTLDEDRGIVFVPTGSASFDFWGGDRRGDNLFANSLIALDAKTGERLWHFQAVHHDIWDRDLPSPPTLVTIERDGRYIDAVAQPTKSGHIYVFDRVSGESLFPIEEKAYLSSDLLDEVASATQPLPTLPVAFSRQKMDMEDVNRFSADYDSLKQVLQSIRNNGQFVPPSEEGTMIFPGFDGGAEWGGSAYNPETGLLFVNANEMPWILTMVPIEGKVDGSLFQQGEQLYASYCMICHGKDLQGSSFHGTALPLKNIKNRLSMDSVLSVLSKGRNEMPSFNFLDEKQHNAITAFLFEDTISAAIPELASSLSPPYSHTGYNRFVDSEGYPAIKPPWGTLNAVNLNSGALEWQVPLGEFEELTSKGISKTGMENYGGPVVTAGGLIFIAGTKDKYLRAFDQVTGEEIWRYQLPFASLATPATYMAGGKQYIVLAAGGGKTTIEKGDIYMAFALPD